MLTADDPAGRQRKISVEIPYDLVSDLKDYRHRGRRRHRRRRDRKAHSANDLDIASDTLQGRAGGEAAASMKRNLSTSMTLADIRDGVFTALLPLDSISAAVRDGLCLPTMQSAVTAGTASSSTTAVLGDIRIRVVGSALEIYSLLGDDAVDYRDTASDLSESNGTKTTSTSSKNDTRAKSGRNGEIKSRPALWAYCGTIDLPIYVDSSRLQFDIASSGRSLIIAGPMKGYCGVVLGGGLARGRTCTRTGRTSEQSKSVDDLLRCRRATWNQCNSATRDDASIVTSCLQSYTNAAATVDTVNCCTERQQPANLLAPNYPLGSTSFSKSWPNLQDGAFDT